MQDWKMQYQIWIKSESAFSGCTFSAQPILHQSSSPSFTLSCVVEYDVAYAAAAASHEIIFPLRQLHQFHYSICIATDRSDIRLR